jgi:outer membrane protein
MKKLLTGLIILVSAVAQAQTKDSTYNFSVKDAVAFALQNQNEVLNASLQADIAVSKVRETVGIGLPQMSASFDVKDFEEIPTSLIPAEFFGGEPGTYAAIQFGTRWNATAGISASQILFDPSYIVGVQASKTYRELSEKNLARTKIETAVTVTKAYYLILLLKERQKVIDANISRMEKLFNDTKALYQNGFVEKIDLDRVTVAYNNVNSEKDKFKRMTEMSERNLKFQVGLPESATVVITDSLDAEAIKNLNVDAGNPDVSKRIEYSILKTQEQLQEFNLKRYKGQYLPSLIAYGSLTTSAQRTEFNIFKSGYRWYPTGVIGATLSLNIFDGLQKENRIRQEKLNLRIINNNLNNFNNAVTLEVTSARSALLDALSSLRTQDENLQLANSVSRTTKLKYDQGVGSNLEVMEAETSLKESQGNYFNALYDAVLAKINLEKALGNFNY